MAELHVELYGELIGRLDEKLSFIADRSAIAKFGLNSRLLSLSLSLPLGARRQSRVLHRPAPRGVKNDVRANC